MYPVEGQRRCLTHIPFGLFSFQSILEPCVPNLKKAIELKAHLSPQNAITRRPEPVRKGEPSEQLNNSAFDSP
jgi:hypothetical protein